MHSRSQIKFHILFIVILSLCFSVYAIQAHPPESSSVVTTNTWVIREGDSQELLDVVLLLNSLAPDSTIYEVYLEPSDYVFDGLVEFPTLSNNLILHGQNARILFKDVMDSDGITIANGINVEMRQIKLIQFGVGPMVTNYGHLVINDSHFNTDASNQPTGEGGGIDNHGILVIRRSMFSHNQYNSTSRPGGAIYNAGELSVFCSAFVAGRASQGGAIYNDQAGNIEIVKSSFHGNIGNGGGAIYNAGNQVTVSEGYWSGSQPVVDDFYLGKDTVSESVIINSLSQYDPQLNPECLQVAVTPLEGDIAEIPRVIDAVKTAVFSYHENFQAPPPIYGMVTTVIRIQEKWAFGIVGVKSPPQQEGNPSSAYLFLGLKNAEEWEITLETQPAFSDLVKNASEEIVHKPVKENLLQGNDQPDPLGIGSAQLSLPFPTGETWSFTGGPHRDGFLNDDGSSDVNTWSALDFAGGSGQIRSMRDGTAYVPCANWVRINHADGWRTSYYHVASIQVSNGQNVSRSVYLGNTSTQVGCGGSATGVHVHVALLQNGFHQSIAGHDVGGWTVEPTSTQYSGCLTRVSTGEQRCTYGNNAVYNDGSVGSGTNPIVPANVNLIQNGTFNTDASLWELWGNYTYGVIGGVLNLGRTSGSFDAAAVRQIANYRANTGSVFEVTLSMGNSSSTTQSVRVLVRDSENFNLQVGCTFAVPPDTPLHPYRIVGRSNEAWSRIMTDIAITSPATGTQDIKLDNIQTKYRPDLNPTTVECIRDVTPPTGAMTSPTAGSHQRGPVVTLGADASDASSGIRKVEFYVWSADAWSNSTWILAGTDTSAPYQVGWDISNLPTSSYAYITLIAYDNAGNNSGYIWDPNWTHITIDRVKPSSNVNPLPATTPNTVVDLTWQGLDNRTGQNQILFDIQYQTGCTGNWSTLFTQTSATVGQFFGTAGTTYCFRSRAIDLAGNIEDWPTTEDARTIITSVIPPGTVTPTSPSGNITSRAPTFTWQKEANSTSYDIQVVRNDVTVIHAQTYSAASVCGVSTCSITPALDLSSDYYSWWVRGVNTGGNGPWSGQGFAITILPGLITQTAPIGAYSGRTPTFTWNRERDSHEYGIWIGQGSTTLHLAYIQASTYCNATTCSYTPPLDLSSNYYVWWVGGYSLGGGGNWTGTGFHVTVTPGLITQTAPIGPYNGRTPTFTWNRERDSHEYGIWIGQGSTTSHLAYIQASTYCNATTCSYTPPLDLSSGYYTWWVGGYSRGGGGPWNGNGFQVTVLPAAVVQLGPQGTITQANPTFTWQRNRDAFEYGVTIAQGSTTLHQATLQANTVCPSQTIGSTCSYTPTLNLPPGGYSWWIGGYSLGGGGPWSSLIFTVQ